MGKKINSDSPGLNSSNKINTRLSKSAIMCGICYNDISEQGILDSCTHEFCFTCINQWSKNENSCPICKRRFFSIEKQWKRVNYCERERVIKKKEKNSQESQKGDTSVVKVAQRNQGGNNFGLSLQTTHLRNILQIIQVYFLNRNIIDDDEYVQFELSFNQGEQTSIIPVQIRRQLIDGYDQNDDQTTFTTTTTTHITTGTDNSDVLNIETQTGNQTASQL